MKKLLVVLLFIPSVLFSQSVRTYNIPSDHADLEAAYDAHTQDLTANDSALTFEITGEWEEASFGVQLDGYTADQTRFVTITASGDARHDGVWSETAFRLERTIKALDMLDDCLVIDGLQCRVTGTNSYQACINSGSAVDIVIKNNICWSNGAGGSNNSYGIQVGVVSSGGEAWIYNNIIYYASTRGLTCGSATSASIYVYNNTFVDCGVALEEDYGDCICINNMFLANTTDTDVPTANINWSATDKSTMRGTNNQVSISNPFADTSANDYRLASATSDGAEDGTSTTVSSLFTTDIQGDTRPQSTSWDIGADEFAVEEEEEEDPVSQLIIISRRNNEILNLFINSVVVGLAF